MVLLQGDSVAASLAQKDRGYSGVLFVPLVGYFAPGGSHASNLESLPLVVFGWFSTRVISPSLTVAQALTSFARRIFGILPKGALGIVHELGYTSF